ncbi:Hypothetical protein CINCED_3A016293 [Cinara cedri]|uniref:Uncharacterized protein n=1 Tax=Cinara cedri TaxID=506608 RepID=A0A5E4M493_9HEMI|nr:Hypothetical protein CINCED_3A016293 [Cinara cedri]
MKETLSSELRTQVQRSVYVHATCTYYSCTGYASRGPALREMKKNYRISMRKYRGGVGYNNDSESFQRRITVENHAAAVQRAVCAIFSSRKEIGMDSTSSHASKDLSSDGTVQLKRAGRKSTRERSGIA